MVPTDDAMMTLQMLYSGTPLPTTAVLAIKSSTQVQVSGPQSQSECADRLFACKPESTAFFEQRFGLQHPAASIVPPNARLATFIRK
jgi:hypothetical protein